MTSFSENRADQTPLKLALFAVSAFLSSFLIFSIQPIFTKVVLPVLGGAPAVWSVAMVVFQGLLLAGYLYAHLLMRWFSLRIAVVIHGLITCAALSTLPFNATPDWGVPPESFQSIWLVKIFLQSVGFPFFALAANAPLLQAWLASNDRYVNVYHLYAASNIGSFAALFSYPFLIEPMIGLATQSYAWGAGFLLFIVLLSACGLSVWNTQTFQRTDGPTIATSSQPISWARRREWVLCASIPAGLLIAATASIQMDVSGISLLWILPLAIYLLSFVYAFRDEEKETDFWPRFVRSVTLLNLVVFALGVHNFFLVLSFGFAAVLGVSMACHKKLYGLRPAENQLTEFYLFLSVGGFIGGIFSSLVALHLFSWTAEYVILLLVAVLVVCRSKVPLLNSTRDLVIGGAGLLLVAAVFGFLSDGLLSFLRIIFLVLAVHLFFLFNSKSHRLIQGACVSALIAVFLVPLGQDTQRSFFGVMKIEEKDGYRRLLHGSTLHGAQEINYSGKPEPLTYFTSNGPMGRSLTALRQSSSEKALRIGVVGLGVGSMSCLKQDNETWTYFEIDPLVVSIARDKNRFQFLSVCDPAAKIVIGDARLTVDQQPRGAFEYLLVDAFSSDAIPAHLVTKEAIQNFLARVTDEGILVFHISNRYINLVPILAKIAEANNVTLYGYETHVTPDEAARMHAGALAVVFVKNEKAVAKLEQLKFQKVPVDPEQALWTDHYTNVSGEIIRHQMRKWFGI